MGQNKNTPPPAKMSTGTAIVITTLIGFSVLLAVDTQYVFGGCSLLASFVVGWLMGHSKPFVPDTSGYTDVDLFTDTCRPENEYFGVNNYGRVGTDDLSGES